MKERDCPSRSRQRGSTIVLVLLVILVVSLLGMSLLLTADVDLRSSRVYADWAASLNDADSGIDELEWRLNLYPGAAAPPTGSTIDINSMTGFDAAIDYDPQGFLSNGQDDDGDGEFDEPDEMQLGRDWEVRLVLQPTDPVVAWEVDDTDLDDGPDFGSRFVLPTIQDSARWKTYTTTDSADADALVLRYKKGADTGLSHSELAADEIVFWDPDLASDDVENPNTLEALGGDGNPANDSAYNITYVDAGGDTIKATGSPVLLVEMVARVERGGNTLGRRVFEAEFVPAVERVVTHGLCACDDLDIDQGASIDSYDSADGAYDSLTAGTDGDVAANDDLEVEDGTTIDGDAEAGGKAKFKGSSNTVAGDLTAGGTITGDRTVGGTETATAIFEEAPCDCSTLDAVREVVTARATNDNASILPNNTNPYTYGSNAIETTNSIYPVGDNLYLGANSSIILTGGTYYFDTISISGAAAVQIGVDDQPTGGDGVIDGPPTTPVKIHVAGGVHIAGSRGFINAGRPRDLQIITGSPKPPDVQLRMALPFVGVIYAPNMKVSIGGGAEVMGAIVADDIEIRTGNSVHFDTALKEILIVRRPIELLAWREIR